MFGIIGAFAIVLGWSLVAHSRQKKPALKMGCSLFLVPRPHRAVVPGKRATRKFGIRRDAIITGGEIIRISAPPWDRPALRAGPGCNLQPTKRR